MPAMVSSAKGSAYLVAFVVTLFMAIVVAYFTAVYFVKAVVSPENQLIKMLDESMGFTGLRGLATAYPVAQSAGGGMVRVQGLSIYLVSTATHPLKVYLLGLYPGESPAVVDLLSAMDINEVKEATIINAPKRLRAAGVSKLLILPPHSTAEITSTTYTLPTTILACTDTGCTRLAWPGTNPTSHTNTTQWVIALPSQGNQPSTRNPPPLPQSGIQYPTKTNYISRLIQPATNIYRKTGLLVPQCCPGHNPTKPIVQVNKACSPRPLKGIYIPYGYRAGINLPALSFLDGAGIDFSVHSVEENVYTVPEGAREITNLNGLGRATVVLNHSISVQFPAPPAWMAKTGTGVLQRITIFNGFEISAPRGGYDLDYFLPPGATRWYLLIVARIKLGVASDQQSVLAVVDNHWEGDSGVGVAYWWDEQTGYMMGVNGQAASPMLIMLRFYNSNGAEIWKLNITVHGNAYYHVLRDTVDSNGYAKFLVPVPHGTATIRIDYAVYTMGTGGPPSCNPLIAPVPCWTTDETTVPGYGLYMELIPDTQVQFS